MENNIFTLVNDLDAAINETYTNYLSLHDQLNKHRGKEIGDTNLLEVNRLLKEIQESFAELYPAYHFIAHRHQYAVNATNEYNDFIEVIKKAGAHQAEKEANGIN